MMPTLYQYVKNTCTQQDMRMPTIFITRDKTTFLGFSTAHSDSTKLLTSSGAILIGQDLLLETSQKALEAAIAYELAHIKFNHQNKYWFKDYITPLLAGPIAATLFPNRVARATPVIAFILPRILIGKRFEKQADAFVYKTMNNAHGLIELCQYYQRKKQKTEDDYTDTYTFLTKADINFIHYIAGMLAYYPNYIGHQFSNMYDWFCYNTLLKPYQSNEARIKTAQEYLDSQRKNNENTI